MATESSANPRQQTGGSMLAEQCTERHPDSHDHQGNEHRQPYWPQYQQQATFTGSGVHVRWRTLLAMVIAAIASLSAVLCVIGHLCFRNHQLSLQLAAQQRCVFDGAMLQKTMTNVTQSVSLYCDCHDAKTQVMSLNSSLSQCNVQHYQQGNILSMCTGQLRATQASLGRTKTGLNTRARVLYSAKTECQEQLSLSKMENRHLEKKLAKMKKSFVAGEKTLKSQMQGLRADLAVEEGKSTWLTDEFVDLNIRYRRLEYDFLLQHKRCVHFQQQAMFQHALSHAYAEDAISRLTVWVTNRQARGMCATVLKWLGDNRLRLVKSLVVAQFQFPKDSEAMVTADVLLISDTGSMPFTRQICTEDMISALQNGSYRYIRYLEFQLSSPIRHAMDMYTCSKELLAVEDYIVRLTELLEDANSRSICQDMLNDIAQWRKRKLSRFLPRQQELNVTGAHVSRLTADPVKLGNSSRSFFPRLWCPQAVLFAIDRYTEDVKEEYQIDSEKKDVIGLGSVVASIASIVSFALTFLSTTLIFWGVGRAVYDVKNLFDDICLSIDLVKVLLSVCRK